MFNINSNNRNTRTKWVLNIGFVILCSHAMILSNTTIHNINNFFLSYKINTYHLFRIWFEYFTLKYIWCAVLKADTDKFNRVDILNQIYV